jgi:thiamine pyrophosphate-dependent acetolactate synthase large subunit-like protein
MNGGQAVAQVLRCEGTTQVFCFPSNYLIDPIAQAGIRPIMARVERVVINMADGFTRSCNAEQIGVVITQGGPGIENAFGAVAQAHADATPLLVLPGGSARARVSLPSTFDAVANYQRITRWADRFVSAQRIPDQLRRAYGYLRSGRPGPVLLELPSDVLKEEFDSASFTYCSLLDWDANRHIQQRNGNRRPDAAPHGVFRCRGDDRWCAITVFTDAEWNSFLSSSGEPRVGA